MAPPKITLRENYKADEPPQRVVMLPPLLAAYATLDGGLSHIAGASNFIKQRFAKEFLSRIYTGVEKLPSAGEIALTDPELILALHPDVVVVWSHSAIAPRELGLPQAVINVDKDISPDTRLRIWSMLGTMSGKSTKAQLFVDEFQAQLHGLESSLRPAVSGPRVAFFIGASEGFGYLAGRDLYLNSSLGFLHARNAAASLGWGRVNLEAVAVLDPDVIILDSTLSEQDPQQLYTSREWSIVRAVRERKVYLMPRFNFWAPPMDEHLILGWLAEILYPDMPRVLRESYQTTFTAIHNVSLSEDDIDGLLFINENRSSTDYTRFSRSNTIAHSP